MDLGTQRNEITLPARNLLQHRINVQFEVQELKQIKKVYLNFRSLWLVSSGENKGNKKIFDLYHFRDQIESFVKQNSVLKSVSYNLIY